MGSVAAKDLEDARLVLVGLRVLLMGSITVSAYERMRKRERERERAGFSFFLCIVTREINHQERRGGVGGRGGGEREFLFVKCGAYFVHVYVCN